MASLFALDLELPVQTPYQVQIDEDFANTVSDFGLRKVFHASKGPNFGCAKWMPGYTIWPREKTPSRELKQGLMEIFAFDGLIQNPDRRETNPNCAFLGNSVLIYDHEAAFSHFMSILPVSLWEIGGLEFLKEHIFFDALRGGALELDRFQGAVEAVDANRLTEYTDSIPSEWNGSTTTGRKIREYLMNCIANFRNIRKALENLL